MADQADTDAKSGADFAREAQARRGTFVGEFWQFVRENKKWWLIPIIVILLLLSVFVLLTSTGAGSLIYPLF